MFKILDCTLRDGGLANNFQFSEQMIQNHILLMARSSIDCIELGYKKTRMGMPLEACEDQYIKKLLEPIQSQITQVKFAFMVDAGGYDETLLVKQSESPFQIARLAFYEYEFPKVERISRTLAALGYEVWLNLMAVSTVSFDRLEELLSEISQYQWIRGFYLVDSNGALYPQQTQKLGQEMILKMPHFQLGIHTHNNLQLALANSLVAKELGFNYYDGSLYGVGRGGGNCPIELLIPSIKGEGADFGAIFDSICPLDPLYKKQRSLMTGLYNVHPLKGTQKEALSEIFKDLRAGLNLKEDQHEVHTV